MSIGKGSDQLLNNPTDAVLKNLPLPITIKYFKISWDLIIQTDLKSTLLPHYKQIQENMYKYAGIQHKFEIKNFKVYKSRIQDYI